MEKTSTSLAGGKTGTPSAAEDPAVSRPEPHTLKRSRIETEMRFALSPALQDALLRSRRLRRAARSTGSTRQLTSTYFDTRQHALRNAGAALRVRWPGTGTGTGTGYEQTIKTAAEGPVGMQNFAESTVALAGPRPDLCLFDPGELGPLRKRAKRLNLQPVFTTGIRRTTWQVKSGKTRFEVALDVGAITSHGASPRTLPVCELEFELQAGNALPMLDFIIALSDEFDLQPQYLTKAQRGYALARPALRPRPAKAKPVPLSPQTTVGESFQRIVAEALRQLQANRQPTLDGAPGGIHQTRVSMRRIRAALRAFKKSLPYDKRKAFNGEFRWLQARLAPARDWHVFLSDTLPRIARSRPGTETDLRLLRGIALSERRRATAEARELLLSRRCTRLLLEFQRWLLELERDHDEVFDNTVKPFAEKVLNKTRRDLLVDARPLSRMSEEERHSLRKRGKKARYATEFFADLWDTHQVKRYLRLLEKLQNSLGEVNDAVVARQVLATLPPRLLTPSTLWLIQSWSQDRVEHGIGTGQPLWRRMQRTYPFRD